MLWVLLGVDIGVPRPILIVIPAFPPRGEDGLIGMDMEKDMDMDVVME